jgi:hypothetical protein
VRTDHAIKIDRDEPRRLTVEVSDTRLAGEPVEVGKRGTDGDRLVSAGVVLID